MTKFLESWLLPIAMLAGIMGPKGQPVAVEPQYLPRKTLSVYVADAQRDGMITD